MTHQRHIKSARGKVIIPRGASFKVATVAALPTATEGYEGELLCLSGIIYQCIKTKAAVWAWIPLFPSAGDPDADRILFWDDSAGVWTWLTLDSGDLAISGTTLGLAGNANELSGLVFTDGLIIQRGASALEAVRPAPTTTSFLGPAAAVTWTNMPLAEAFFNGDASYFFALDTTNVRQMRLSVDNSVAGSANAIILIRQTPNFVAFTTVVSVSIATANIQQSAWTALPAGTIGSSMIFSVRGSGGDGAVDPVFRSIYIETR